MQVLGRIFKEVLIAVIIFGLLALLGFFLFRNQYSFLSGAVPNAVTYRGIEYGEYDVDSANDLEEQKDPTKTYQNTTWNLKDLEESRRVHTGTPNPFSSFLDEDSDTDIPSERVSIQNAANTTPEVPTNISGDAGDMPVSGGEGEAPAEGATEAPAEGERSLE